MERIRGNEGRFVINLDDGLKKRYCEREDSGYAGVKTADMRA
jgi:hypothetical protein